MNDAIKNGLPIAAVGLLMGVSACDLSVVNSGPVQDEFLDEPGAHSAVVAGAGLRLSRAINMVGFFGSEAAKEYTQGGRIHPIKLPPEPRQLDNEQIPNNAWNNAHQARWVAEDGVRRLREKTDDFDSSDLAARVLLYAGYANRLLGENMCEAVVDGSEVQSRSAHLEAAEAHFTEAMSVASAAGMEDVATAARAGRASVRLFLGNDAGALEDAVEVPRDFVFQAEFDAATNTNDYNWINYISSNTPYRAHSVVVTFYEDYYPETGDPRVPWVADADVPTAEFTWVPWLQQMKYPQRDSPVTLSSGREMVLIGAEVALRAGNWQEALALVNGLREGLVSDFTGEPLPLWSAENAEEAWTALKRERGIELWLETRRLGDLWRWVEDDVPGEMEDVSDVVRLCFPVATSELQTNPEILLDYQSPTNPLFTGVRDDFPNR